MQKVTVKRDELMTILTSNMGEHRNVFEKALEGYKARLHEELERRLDDLRAGRKVNQYIGLPEPEDHTRDYERVIKMVQMSVSDEIELTSQEFSQYVQDDWSWKQNWSTTNAAYGIES